MRAGSDHLGTQLFFAFVCCKLKFYFRSTYLKSQNLIWDRNVSYLRPMTMTSMFEWSWLQYFIHLVSWTIKTFTWGFKSRLTYSLATQSFVCYSGTINSLLHLYYSNYHLRASVGVMYLDNPQNAVFSMQSYLSLFAWPNFYCILHGLCLQRCNCDLTLSCNFHRVHHLLN